MGSTEKKNQTRQSSVKKSYPSKPNPKLIHSENKSSKGSHGALQCYFTCYKCNYKGSFCS